MENSKCILIPFEKLSIALEGNKEPDEGQHFICPWEKCELEEQGIRILYRPYNGDDSFSQIFLPYNGLSIQDYGEDHIGVWALDGSRDAGERRKMFRMGIPVPSDGWVHEFLIPLTEGNHELIEIFTNNFGET